MAPFRVGLRALVPAVFALAVAAPGCQEPSMLGVLEDWGTKPAEVSLQITGSAHLQAVISELNARGIKATVWLTAAEMNANCDLLAAFPERGHEVAGMYPGVITSSTTYAEQQQELDAMLEASTRCVQRAVVGFRGVGSSSNSATHTLMDDYGIRYTVRGNDEVLLSQYTAQPYLLKGHTFSVIPAPLAVLYGRPASLCDWGDVDARVSRPTFSSEQIVSYEKAALDQSIRSGDPVVMEWNARVTNPNDEKCWTAFKETLNHIVSLGTDVQDVTASHLAQTHPPTVVLTPRAPILGSQSE